MRRRRGVAARSSERPDTTKPTPHTRESTHAQARATREEHKDGADEVDATRAASSPSPAGDSRHPGLSPDAAAPYHFRPNLSSLFTLTQSDRTKLAHSYRTSLIEFRLQRRVEAAYHALFPDAVRLASQPASGPARSQTSRTATRKLWDRDTHEQEMERRKRVLAKLKAEDRAGTELHRAEHRKAQATKQLDRPTIMAEQTHPSVALLTEGSPQLLLPPSKEDHTAVESQALLLSNADPTSIPTLDVALSALSSSTPTFSIDAPATSSHPLNSVTTFHILPLSTRRELDAENRMSMRLFGSKLHHHAMRTRPATATTRTNRSEEMTASSPSTSPPPQDHRRVASSTSVLQDGPVLGLAGSSTRAGTMSRVGIRLAISNGLRSRWQVRRHATLRMEKSAADAATTRTRERPFDDPSLSNPWLYIPSLYDSAAHDAQLNQLAIRLGVPQPKPVPQPRDKSNHWFDDADDDDDNEDSLIAGFQPAQQQQSQSAPPETQRTVEEALKLAEVEEKRQEETMRMQHRRAQSIMEAARSATNGSAASAPPTDDHSDESASPVCPVPGTLWQSELSLLPVPPPAKLHPFVSKTPLAAFAPYVLFEPPVGSPDVPRRFRNEEKRQKQAADRQAREEILTGVASHAMPTAAQSDASTAVAIHLPTPPTPPLVPRRPASAHSTTFGSFIVRQTSAAAAAKVRRQRRAASLDGASASATPTSSSSAPAMDDEHNSTIFSLTQIGAAEEAKTNETDADHGANDAPLDSALILHPSVASPPRTSAATAAASAGAPLISPREYLPAGNRLLDVQDTHQRASLSVAIPQRVDSRSDAESRHAELVRLADERTHRTLNERIAASAWQVHGQPTRPQSARVAINSARARAVQMRLQQPPTIPAHTRPSTAIARLRHDQRDFANADQARTTAAAVREANVIPRAFIAVGRRRDFQFRTPGADSAPSTTNRPPTHARHGRSTTRPKVKRSYTDDLAPTTTTAPEADSAPPSSRDAHDVDLESPLIAPPPIPSVADLAAFAEQVALWDRIDLVDEGERQVPGPPMPPMPTAPTAPTAPTVRARAAAAATATMRPTSAFPRPRTAAAAREKTMRQARPQSAGDTAQ